MGATTYVPAKSADGGGVWGEITGTLADQTDLKAVTDNKVDKISGKGLSTNDYTDVDEAKVSFISVTQAVNLDTMESHLTNTSNPHSVDKTDVGLSNVDNTSDLNKPVSTATQAALDTKQATLVSGTNIKTVNSTSLLGSGDIVISGGVDGLTLSTTETSVGISANGSSYGAAVGYGADSRNYGAAVGKNANGSSYGAAVGYGAKTNNKGINTVAIGAYSNVERAKELTFTHTPSATNKSSTCIIGLTEISNVVNGTFAEQFLDASSARLTLLNDSLLNFTLKYNAIDSTAGDAKTWEITGSIKNDGGVVALVGTPTKTVLGETAGASAWDIQVTADDTNDSLKLEFKGDTKTIRRGGSFYLTDVRV